MDLIGGINSVITATKSLREASKAIEDAQFSLMVSDLNLQLVDLKSEVARLVEENEQLKRELNKKKERKITVLGDFCYVNNSDNIPVGKAYCTSCYENYEILNSFTTLNSLTVCTKCKSTVKSMDAKRIMTPDLFETVKADHSDIIRYL